MNYVIYDLEATCFEGQRANREIIEIGAVMINDDHQIISQFDTFIRPVQHPVLSDFCIELTSITQMDVDHSPFFKEVITAFKKWLGVGNADYILCSWGFFDPNQLKTDCKYHGESIDWIRGIMSQKHQYAEIKSLEATINFAAALERENITFTGQGHRAIDDARNMASLFIKYFDHWKIPHTDKPW